MSRTYGSHPWHKMPGSITPHLPEVNGVTSHTSAVLHMKRTFHLPQCSDVGALAVLGAPATARTPRSSVLILPPTPWLKAHNQSTAVPHL